MTPALSILCAVLVVGSWLYLSIRDRKRIAMLERHRDAANTAYLRDHALLTEAWALLHDERHKAKTHRQAEWVTARDMWTRKWRGEL